MEIRRLITSTVFTLQKFLCSKDSINVSRDDVPVEKLRTFFFQLKEQKFKPILNETVEGER